MLLAMVGLNHRTAPVAVRERLSIPEYRLEEVLAGLSACEGVESCVVLSTCNRSEIYAAVAARQDIDAVWQFISGSCPGAGQEARRYTYTCFGTDVVRHLFRVASGLDSMIVGETQILGQVKQAYETARACGTVNWLINLLFQQALAVGKRVRNETGIDRNPVSVSYAAVELARQTLGSLEGRPVLIVGAGKMSELTVKHLLANGISGVIVSNRSFPRAQQLAAAFNGRAVRFEELYRWMRRVDIVISCTAATHYVIRPEPMTEVMRDRQHRKLFLIDIAVPRDVDPEVGKLEGVVLYDIDSLQSVVDANLAERRRAAVAAEEIIDEEVQSFTEALGSRFVVPTIVALKKRGDEVKEKELRRALNRLGEIGEREAKVISSLANSIVNQLLHEPIVRLKQLALRPEGYRYADILRELFDLDVQQLEARTCREKKG
ncbi:MAG: glutamyl-tRNA reductase [Bacillota bacterium]